MGSPQIQHGSFLALSMALLRLYSRDADLVGSFNCLVLFVVHSCVYSFRIDKRTDRRSFAEQLLPTPTARVVVTSCR